MRVYAIGLSGAVKFGSTTNLRKRLEAIQISHHRRLRVLGSIRAEQELENLIHFLLRRYRIRGEWFRLCGETRHVVRLMRSDDLGSLCSYLESFR